MEFIRQAQAALPWDFYGLPEGHDALLMSLLKTGSPYGYCKVRMVNPGIVPRGPALVMGFYAPIPTTLRLQVGSITWDLTINGGDFAWALKGVAPFPAAAVLFDPLIITKITGEVMIIYCDFWDRYVCHQIATTTYRDLCPGLIITSGLMHIDD
jgi:hypothetical protein